MLQHPSTRPNPGVSDVQPALDRPAHANLGAGERAKLEDHYDLVRQLEVRIGGLREASCSSPKLLDVPAQGGEAYEAQLDQMFDLVAAAFACDLVRVVSFSLGDLPGDLLGAPGEDVHDSFAHRVGADAEATATMEEYHRIHMEQAARLLDRLDAIPAGSGTLLDHTLIVYASDLGDGTHGYQDWPALLIGGAWQWDSGRYLHYPAETPIEGVGWNGPLPRLGLPHQHLLTSVARAMGLELEGDAFGLPEVTNRDGETIDLRGGLPGLEG
jgi:hypothetical protein